MGAQDGLTFALNSRRNSCICSRAVIKSACSTAVSSAVSPITAPELPNQGKSGEAKTSDTGLQALANARLNLIVAHSTEPHLWIQDINQSPFNVGFPIRLDDFDKAHVTELNERHGGKLKTEDDLKELMELLGGQPYLIRQALYALATNAGLSLAKLIEIAPKVSISIRATVRACASQVRPTISTQFLSTHSSQ